MVKSAPRNAPVQHSSGEVQEFRKKLYFLKKVGGYGQATIAFC